MSAEEEILQCVIWCEVKADTLRTTCCKQLIWETCCNGKRMNPENCPSCNQTPYSVERDPLILKLLEVLAKECPCCKCRVLLVDFSKHHAKCNSKISWKICEAPLIFHELSSHVKQLHGEEFENAFIEEEKEKGSRKIEGVADTPRLKEVRKQAKEFKDEEINSINLKAKRSRVNNKYYCGRAIEYYFTDKVRGLPNVCQANVDGGLNWAECMKLDLEANELLWLSLINHSGNKSEFDLDDNKFKWGKIMSKKRGTICGKGRDVWADCNKLTKVFLAMDKHYFPYYKLLFPDDL